MKSIAATFWLVVIEFPSGDVQSFPSPDRPTAEHHIDTFKKLNADILTNLFKLKYVGGILRASLYISKCNGRSPKTYPFIPNRSTLSHSNT